MKKLRDMIAITSCNWILNHIGSPQLREEIHGLLKYALGIANLNDMDGKTLGDLFESMQQMANGETVET